VARKGGLLFRLTRRIGPVFTFPVIPMAAASHAEPVHGGEDPHEQDPDPVAPDELFHLVPPALDLKEKEESKSDARPSERVNDGKSTGSGGVIYS
jgi:hypothetical protein